jgi:hypothetical protein
MEHEHVGLPVAIALVEVSPLGLEEYALQELCIVHVADALELVSLLLLL